VKYYELAGISSLVTATAAAPAAPPLT